MYIAENQELNAYVLPIDPRMLKDGQYSYEGYQSLQPNIDLVRNIVSEVYVDLETMEISIDVWPIPLYSTYTLDDGFQYYNLILVITSS